MNGFQRVVGMLVCLACLAAAFGPIGSAAPTAGASTTAPKQRQYRCTKCREIHTFDRPGNYKCPKCGKNLIPVS